jgi:hypothetical protein
MHTHIHPHTPLKAIDLDSENELEQTTTKIKKVVSVWRWSTDEYRKKSTKNKNVPLKPVDLHHQNEIEFSSAGLKARQIPFRTPPPRTHRLFIFTYLFMVFSSSGI